ncbi:MAG: CidA/LrgA family protein [Gammaproteobacteria bacterium]|nr:MAG: CidA/LrgA family protein [Gammaproteobacteria bacterium]
MLLGFIILLLGAFLGNIISSYSGLPVPGTVFGILLVLVCLAIIKKVPHSLKLVSDGLLKYLALFYVPAGVGLVAYLDLLAADWSKILVALLVSSVITIIVVAMIMDKITSIINIKSSKNECSDSAADSYNNGKSV